MLQAMVVRTSQNRLITFIADADKPSEMTIVKVDPATHRVELSGRRIMPGEELKTYCQSFDAWIQWWFKERYNGADYLYEIIS